MPKAPAIDRFRDRAELAASLPDIVASPKDDGRVEAIVVRPESGVRSWVERAELSFAGGVVGITGQGGQAIGRGR